MKPSTIIYQVDAFTTDPFKGNPAGVCILDNKPSGTWMQNIAMEMNLSETAFVFPGEGSFRIRFFSPEAEIPLCGHATLSASHIMYETGMINQDQEILFSSKAGELKIRKRGKWITMNFPAYEAEPIKPFPGFKAITGVKPQEIHRTSHGWILVMVENEADVRSMNPDFSQMRDSGFGKLIVTAPASETNFDFCVRCFVPDLGINEDPVTGSAHCALVPFWSKKTGKAEFISHQVSKRSGILKVSLKDDRVEISGRAKTILRGELLV